MKVEHTGFLLLEILELITFCGLSGWEAYKFYMCIAVSIAILGTATLLLATAFFRNEIAVRNFIVFSLCITVVSLE